MVDGLLGRIGEGLDFTCRAPRNNSDPSEVKINFYDTPHYTSILTAHEPLAPSPRIIALLARRLATVNPKMALVEVPQETAYPPLEEKKPFTEPAPVLVTPCDPWPRPYFLENGLRRVAPYHYTYNTYCKERWRGRGLLDIFSSEFRDRPLEYYVSVGSRMNEIGLTGSERCHRTWRCCCQWQAGPQYITHC